MAIETICSGCGKRLSVADENAGKRARCPACGHIYSVPPLPAAADSAAEQGQDYLASQDTAAQDTAAQQSGGAESAPQYWMRTVDGAEYGPVDRATLDRWFREGRVGPGYQLRQHQHGPWQAADAFRGTAGSSSDNPYQVTSSQEEMFAYPKADQGGLVLAMGVLGLFCCPIFGIPAWVLGHIALNDIQHGRANPAGETLVRIGYYLGIVSAAIIVLQILLVIGYLIMLGLAV